MAQVRMLLHVTGGRADGTEWPHAGEILECDMREAVELIGAGIAVAADGARAAQDASGDGSAGDEPQEPENGSQDGAPGVRAPKAEWEMHAVNLGITPELAASMTKAQLIQQFRQ